MLFHVICFSVLSGNGWPRAWRHGVFASVYGPPACSSHCSQFSLKISHTISEMDEKIISKHLLVDGRQCNLYNLDLSIAFQVPSEKTSWKSLLGWGWWPTMDIKFRCCVLLGKLFILCQQLWAVWTTANSYRSLPQCHTPVWRLRRRYWEEMGQSVSPVSHLPKAANWETWPQGSLSKKFFWRDKYVPSPWLCLCE